MRVEVQGLDGAEAVAALDAAMKAMLLAFDASEDRREGGLPQGEVPPSDGVYYNLTVLRAVRRAVLAETGGTGAVLDVRG